jgi:ketosteroid isomerase-like protein
MYEGLKVCARRILVACVVASCACVVAGQTQSGGSRKVSKDEAAVLAADRAWADAIARGDVPALEKLFADDYVIVSPDGAMSDRRREINNLRPAPDVVTYYFRTEDVTARVYKDAAVVRGRAVWKVKYKGRDIDNNRRYTSTYIKRKGSWLLVAQQISVNVATPAAASQTKSDGSEK